MNLPDFPQQCPDYFGAMAFDFGTRRIGVAHGQSVTGTASALEPLPARDGIPEWQHLESLIRTWQPAFLVVGIPLNMDGSRSPLCDRAEKFGRRLNARFRLPCFGIDERLSSQEAGELQSGAGRGQSLDSLAASLILETWFSELKRQKLAKPDTGSARNSPDAPEDPAGADRKRSTD